jgi:hypothetical protein
MHMWEVINTMVLIIAMLYRALPRLGVRAMSETTIMKDAEELIDRKMNPLLDKLDAKIDTAVASVDARVEKIFSNDVPHVVEEFGGTIKAGLREELGQLNQGMEKVAESFKMAFIGNKGNEAKAGKKAAAEVTAQQRDFIKQTIITKYPQAAIPLQVAEKAGVLDDLLDQAIKNPEMAEGIIKKFTGGKVGEGQTGAMFG